MGATPRSSPPTRGAAIVAAALSLCGCGPAAPGAATSSPSRAQASAPLAAPMRPASAPAPAHAVPSGDEPPPATLRLTAVCEGGAADPTALDVALTTSAPPSAGPPVFRLEDRVHGVAGMASLISAAEAADERGSLSLARRMATDADGRDTLELKAPRAAVGAVTLRYRAKSVPVAEVGAKHGLRHDANGLGGLGMHFIVLPESTPRYRIRVEWAPPACAPPPPGKDRVAMSSFGSAGDAAEVTGPLEALRMGSYFIGRPTLLSIDRGSMRVRAAWFGEPSFDPIDASAWAARAFEAERAFFADNDPSPYHIFARVLPQMRDNRQGSGYFRSFISAIGPAMPWGARLRVHMAHEMLHRWIGIGLRFAGADGLNFWFTEGFNVHYTRVILLRAGLLTPDEFLEDLKQTTVGYYSGEHRFASNEEIRRGFWEDGALSMVPYNRGALYAAELDAAIRGASRGARSLDDVMRDLFRLSLTAKENEYGLRELPQAAFREAVARELGEAGVDRFEAVILRGELAAPPSSAFGPCFKREARPIAQFELGFDEARSLNEPKAVRGLRAGSAAAKAGLVEGDAILSFESPLLDPEKEAVVTLSRGGKKVIVRYLPGKLGPKLTGFEWVREKSVPDDQCRKVLTASLPPAR